MSKILSFDIHGVSVEEVLEEFNERREEEFDIKKKDIISLSVRNADEPHKIAQPDGSTKDSKVIVTIFYWE